MTPAGWRSLGYFFAPVTMAVLSTCFTDVPSTCQLAGAVSASLSLPRAARTAAAACLMTGTVCGDVRLDHVPPSSGHRSVSPMTSCTRSTGTRSSSANACASSVRDP